jgi:hypothetical protein
MIKAWISLKIFHPTLTPTPVMTDGRSQWPPGLRRRSVAARLLELWARIHLGHGCLPVVSVGCCQVEASAMSWSPVQRSFTDCGAPLCVIYKPREWGGRGPFGGGAWHDKNKQNDRRLSEIGHDSSVGIAICYELDRPGIEYRWMARFSAQVQIGPKTHPTSYTIGTGPFRI